MFAVIYRWRIRPELEAAFERGWRLGTEAIRRDVGGLGSRLHKTGAGVYFAYAQWPDAETFQRARAARMPYCDPEARRLYTEALAGGEAEVVLMGEVVDDLLVTAP